MRDESSESKSAQKIAKKVITGAAPTIAGYVGDVVFSKRYEYDLYVQRLKQLHALTQYSSQISFTGTAHTLIENVQSLQKQLPPAKKGAAIVVDMHSAAWYTNVVNALIGDVGIALQLQARDDDAANPLSNIFRSPVVNA
jgi:hypothetical protein